MSKLESEWIMTISVILLLIAVFMVAGKRDELKAEAVERGFAEWVVDEKNGTTWKWKEEVK